MSHPGDLPRSSPRRAVPLALFFLGCSSAVPQPAEAPAPPPPKRAAAAQNRPAPVSVHAVEQAAQPYHGLRLGDGARFAASKFMTELSRFDVICFGEEHPNVAHHWAELATFEELLARARVSGRSLGLGLEMIAKQKQKTVNRFMAGEGDQRQLLKEIEWNKHWGYHYNLYRPLVELAREHRLPVLALNADQRLTRRVAEAGLEGLDDEARDDLPELDLSDTEHRRWFEAATQGHPPGEGDPEDFYAAQVVWDETMADSAAAYLGEHRPARQLLIVAGAGHCRARGIPRRITRRLSDVRAASVTVLPAGEEPDRDMQAAFDYAFVLGRED